jgi:uncharacterized protein YjiS (DUF1127 family)
MPTAIPCSSRKDQDEEEAVIGSMLFGFAPSRTSGAGSSGVNVPVPQLGRFGRPSGGRPRQAVAQRARRLRGWLREAWRRHRSRHCLARMDGYLLKDIGLSYGDAEAEMNKPFWVE